ncbi:protein kinase domain-containing protein [Streptomyces chumphonensis]|uniref:protein kinase domain-containing protein n=1 Tax=Streptomyces chumphonensis TaxID=1214925 RepID=UPI003D72A8F1
MLRTGDPATVGPYRLLGRLGAGGMGQVFLGRAPNGRVVAVKVIHAELAADEEFRRRFRSEVTAARRVSGPRTAPVLGSDTEAAVPWVATGYVPGPSLHDVVTSLHGPLPEASVWRIAAGLAAALRDVHAAGIVHRDLKPSNVLITLDGPQVIDFGIARAAEASVATRTGSLVGSPGYMPPEQIRGETVTEATDVFALGAVLVFAATGTGPFGAGQPSLHTVLYRVLHENPELGPDEGPLSGALRDLTVRCLAREADDRPSVEEVAAVTADHAGASGTDDAGLPPALTARLGRDAAALLALEGPEPTQVSTPATPPPAPTAPPPPSEAPPLPPPPSAPPPSALPTVTAAVPGPGPAPGLPPGPAAPPGPARSRRVPAVAGTAVAVVVALALTVLLVRPFGDDGKEQADGSPGASSDPRPGPDADRASPPEEAEQPEQDEEEPEAPLHDELPSLVREEGEILVYWDDHGLPLAEGTGEDEGFEPALAMALSEQLGVDLTFRQVNYDRQLSKLTTAARGLGELNAVAMTRPLTHVAHPEQSTDFDFVPYFVESEVLVVPEGRTGEVKNLGDLCGRTVVTRSGLEEQIHERSTECATPIVVTEVPYESDAVESVRAGEADAWYALHADAVGYLAEPEGAGLAIAEARMKPAPIGLAVLADAEPLADVLRQALQALIEDGTYTELLERWGMEDLAVDSATVVD